jgi:biotin carboxyl carrier protein
MSPFPLPFPLHNLQIIASDVSGCFYARPFPGAVEFVQVDSLVEPGTVVGIVESEPNLFVEVSAEVSGRIVEVRVQDRQFIMTGQPLFFVRSVE